MKQSRCTPVRGRILLVDDEQDLLDILAFALRTEGYDVDMACDGQMALDRVSAKNYDLIIADIKMPVMNGEAFYSELCNSYPRLCKRVVFCTGDLANPATQRFLSTTDVPVILKPFQLRRVLELISLKLTENRTLADVSLPTGTPPLTRARVVLKPIF